MSGHLLLLYRDTRDLHERLSALTIAGQHVVVACGPDTQSIADTVLAGHPIVHVDRFDIHTRPAAALASYRRLGCRTATGLTIVTEPQPGTTALDRARAARCEAACDLAGLGDEVRLICVYPADTTDPLLADLLRTHPELLTPHGRQLNPDHADPVSVLRRLTPEPPPTPKTEPILYVSGSSSIKDLGALRSELTAHLADLPTLIRTDFVAAVNELATNGYLHGAPPVDVTVWVTGEVVECRVTDHGTGSPDPAAGYLPRPASGRSGTGLWLARQLCDDIDMWRDGDTFTVRAATVFSARRNREHSGAVARAETASTRADLAVRRAHRRRP